MNSVASNNNNDNAKDKGMITASVQEIEFFRCIRTELKDCNDFFTSSEKLYKIRYERILGGYTLLKQMRNNYDHLIWSRLLKASMILFRDLLLLKNFAIMNYCGFTKILKKHDKITGAVTRDSFMENVMNVQNISHYPFVNELLGQTEKLFIEIQNMER
jgi:SPX domain protein involved in polyphosphate accumulation